MVKPLSHQYQCVYQWCTWQNLVCMNMSGSTTCIIHLGTWWSGPLLCMACTSSLGSIGFYVNFHRDVGCGQWNTSFSMLFSNLKTGEFAYAIWIEKVPNASLSYRRSSSGEKRRAFLPPWNWYLVDFSLSIWDVYQKHFYILRKNSSAKNASDDSDDRLCVSKEQNHACWQAIASTIIQ